MGANIQGYDPEGTEAARPLLGEIHYAGSAYDAAHGAAALVTVTEWDAFRALHLDRLKSVMEQPVLVDLRNIYRREEVEKAGFHYTSIGRPENAPAPLADAQSRVPKFQ